jgi:hypothetical protein
VKIIKAICYVVELYYMDESTPDHITAFVNEFE